MFDPFGDFAEAGYLRNTALEKNLELVKIAEHELFRAQLPMALDFLSRRARIEYADFLKVHQILFNGLYPWAGKDRADILPDRAVSKGSLFFSHPHSSQRAVQEGLIYAQDKQEMSTRPGFVMGMFAYAHPFLDGNGRTILLVHAELCFRADMSIDWMKTDKTSYLESLTREIEDPHAGHLDCYLRPFISKKIPRERWLESVADIPGLDGTDADSNASSYDDPEVSMRYQVFEQRRRYKLDNPS
jgi:cell filamentation protein